MKKILLVIAMFSVVPLYAGRGTKKPRDTRSRLVKTVVELLNSKRKKDTVKKRKNDRKEKRRRKTRKKSN